MTKYTGRLGGGVVLWLVIAMFAGAASADSIPAEVIYEVTGVQGGLVVHLGCGDGKLTAALRAGGRYLVHGLDTDVACVAKTRELLHCKGLYGPVSADHFDGRHLPYVRDLVNLLVASDLGEVRKTLSLGKLISPGHHYRCHRSKATERFLIWPKRGAEFVDLQGDNHMRHDWLRAPCFTGATPANGLFYVPPSQCFCYPGVKVFGFLAMSAEAADELKVATEANLQRGPAFGQIPNPKSEIPTTGPCIGTTGSEAVRPRRPCPPN